MYLRHTTRKKDGKVHRYWSLVRSVRVGRRVIQWTVAQLGELDERGRIAARALARHLIGAPEEAQLFDEDCRDVAAPVRLKGIRVERSRQLRAPGDRDHQFQAIVITRSRASRSPFPGDRDRHFRRVVIWDGEAHTTDSLQPSCVRRSRDHGGAEFGNIIGNGSDGDRVSRWRARDRWRGR
jgi:hypothetical protein